MPRSNRTCDPTPLRVDPTVATVHLPLIAVPRAHRRYMQETPPARRRPLVSNAAGGPSLRGIERLPWMSTRGHAFRRSASGAPSRTIAHHVTHARRSMGYDGTRSVALGQKRLRLGREWLITQSSSALLRHKENRGESSQARRHSSMVKPLFTERTWSALVGQSAASPSPTQCRSLADGRESERRLREG